MCLSAGVVAILFPKKLEEKRRYHAA